MSAEKPFTIRTLFVILCWLVVYRQSSTTASPKTRNTKSLAIFSPNLTPRRKRDTLFSVEFLLNFANFENSLTRTLLTERVDSMLYAHSSNLLLTRNSLSKILKQRQRPRRLRLGAAKQP